MPRPACPMMPVVAGQRSTKIQMLLYTLLLAPIALVPAWLGVAGAIYAAVAIGAQPRLHRPRDRRAARAT